MVREFIKWYTKLDEKKRAKVNAWTFILLFPVCVGLSVWAGHKGMWGLMAFLIASSTLCFFGGIGFTINAYGED